MAEIQTKLLIVEDDQRLARLLQDFLESEGFEVKHTAEGEQGLFYCRHYHVDLVILDINLPGINGFNVCKTLRQENFSGQILMLTTNDNDLDEIEGLTIGADDYVTKPVSPEVLLARVNNRLKKSTTQDQRITFGDLSIQVPERKVTLKSHEVLMTNREFDILVYLAQSADTIITRDSLTRVLRGTDYDGIDRSIDLTISRLRKKLNIQSNYPKGLQTVHGKGYLLAKDGWSV